MHGSSILFISHTLPDYNITVGHFLTKITKLANQSSHCYCLSFLSYSLTTCALVSTHMPTCTYTQMHTQTQAHTHKYIHIQIHTHANTFTHTHTNTHTCKYIQTHNTQAHVHTHKCTHVGSFKGIPKYCLIVHYIIL